ncbi:MAG: tyrosine-type recombinase/integrase [Candidatus Aminicenantales bacterium]
MAAVEILLQDVRHTAATYMVISGIDLVTVKEILGHATIQMTTQKWTVDYYDGLKAGLRGNRRKSAET